MTPVIDVFRSGLLRMIYTAEDFIMIDTNPEFMTALKKQLMAQVAEYPVNKQFDMRLAKPDTWIIIPFNPSAETPRIHVLIGEKYALVIDPTDTPYDLRTYIEENVTDKPLLVANTHSHHDHTYANYLFDDCTIYMSETCRNELQDNRDNGRFRTDLLGNTHKSMNPGTVIKDGDIIDLGGRIIEAIAITPCHAPSSILYLDRTAGILFTGDEIDPGQVNMWNTPVETFRDNIVKLLERRDEFDMICAPHNGTPMHADILKYYLENCDRIMSGIEGDLDVGSTTYLLNPFENRPPEAIEYRRWDPVTRRSFWKGTAINYNVDLIFNRQLNEPHRTARTNPPKKD